MKILFVEISAYFMNNTSFLILKSQMLKILILEEKLAKNFRNDVLRCITNHSNHFNGNCSNLIPKYEIGFNHLLNLKS